MKKFLWCLVLGIFGMSAALVQSASKDSKTPTSPRVYWERSITISGGSHTGIYVDPDGNIFSYAYGLFDNWQPLPNLPPSIFPNPKITEQDLKDYYSPRKKFIRQIEPEELQAKLELLAEASKGRIIIYKSGTSDIQEDVVSRCFIYNEKDQNYKEAKLSEVEMRVSYNSSPSAIQLVGWLESLYREAYPPKPQFGLPFPTGGRQ